VTLTVSSGTGDTCPFHHFTSVYGL